jgi:hypothetical protein
MPCANRNVYTYTEQHTIRKLYIYEYVRSKMRKRHKPLGCIKIEMSFTQRKSQHLVYRTIFAVIIAGLNNWATRKMFNFPYLKQVQRYLQI